MGKHTASKNKKSVTTKTPLKNEKSRMTVRLNHELICKILERMARLEGHIQYLNKERYTHHAGLNILRNDIVKIQNEQQCVKENELDYKYLTNVKENELEYKYEYLTNTSEAIWSVPDLK